MLVSLLNDVRALGPKGAIVDVPDGYASTFLFPEHLAVTATKDVIAKDQALENRPKETKEERQDRELAGEIDGIEIVISVKVEKGIVTPPVTAGMVRQGLKDLGYKISFDCFSMKPMTEIGTFEVPINFPAGFEATISVVVEEAT
ncbi:MAG: 50S ribosomal protein L9 [Patescibacteria group bacterium]